MIRLLCCYFVFLQKYRGYSHTPLLLLGLQGCISCLLYRLLVRGGLLSQNVVHSNT
nr:MAG TPA: hypothetical protein [Caudoviricetes sp.]